MKKILAVLLLSLGMQTAFAGNASEVELADGFFFVGDKNPISINLDKLSPSRVYDIICITKAHDANTYPVKLLFSMQNQSETSAWEKTFTSERERAIFFPHMTLYTPHTAKLTIQVLEGKGVANPVQYNCYAEDRG